MPLQNRVQPDGEILADPTRGLFMGNRGILHDAARTLGKARWRHKAWVTCLLAFKGRHRNVMAPNRYTELFFLDEAVAFAAGHRPCAECRRADYTRFRAAAGITSKIAAFDTDLHQHRAVPRHYAQRRHQAPAATLPEGAFILSQEGIPQLLMRDALLPYAPSGYGAPVSRKGLGEVTVLTPEPLLVALREGYRLTLSTGADRPRT